MATTGRMTTAWAAMVAGLWLSAATAGSPIPLDQVATVAEIAGEAEAKIKELGELIKDETAYGESPEKIKLSSSLLSVLAQAVVDHPSEHAMKAAAPSVRDAAKKIAASKDFTAAAEGLKALQAAAAGNGAPAEKEFNWAKLSRMGPLMTEMENRSQTLRRVLKRSRNPDADSVHATVIAVLAVAAHADTHEVKNPADIPEWQAWSVEQQKSMSDVAAAIKAKDLTKGMERFTAAQAVCTKCHEKYRD